MEVACGGEQHGMGDTCYMEDTWLCWGAGYGKGTQNGDSMV